MQNSCEHISNVIINEELEYVLMKLYIWLMIKHILLTEFEKELSKGIKNKEQVNYAFKRLLEFHNQYNIYFPACSPEVFINHNHNLSTNEKPIKGKIEDWIPVKIILDFNKYHRKIAPFLDFVNNSLVKYYNEDKIAYLNKVYDFKKIMHEEFPFYIGDYQTRDHLDYLFHNFYSRKDSSATASLIYWQLEDKLNNQTTFLKYIDNVYNIKLKKVLKIKSEDYEPREKHIKLINQIKRISKEFKENN